MIQWVEHADGTSHKHGGRKRNDRPEAPKVKKHLSIHFAPSKEYIIGPSGGLMRVKKARMT
jgi:hypothetical protein